MTGFALVYVPFGNGVSLATLPCLLTYLVMWRMRDQAATFAWLIDFTFLIGWCAAIPRADLACLYPISPSSLAGAWPFPALSWLASLYRTHLPRWPVYSHAWSFTGSLAFVRELCLFPGPVII